MLGKNKTCLYFATIENNSCATNYQSLSIVLVNTNIISHLHSVLTVNDNERIFYDCRTVLKLDQDLAESLGVACFTLTKANARNVRLYYPYWQYTNFLYFDLYLYSAYAVHNVQCKLGTSPEVQQRYIIPVNSQRISQYTSKYFKLKQLLGACSEFVSN